MTHRVTWLDSGRAPICAPNPRYPDGMDVDLARDARRACSVKLPYPAPRVGQYLVECDVCKIHILVTTAGRADDPRSVKIACRNQ